MRYRNVFFLTHAFRERTMPVNEGGEERCAKIANDTHTHTHTHTRAYTIIPMCYTQTLAILTRKYTNSAEVCFSFHIL
jgi:hypothetical protein